MLDTSAIFISRLLSSSWITPIYPQSFGAEWMRQLRTGLCVRPASDFLTFLKTAKFISQIAEERQPRFLKRAESARLDSASACCCAF